MKHSGGAMENNKHLLDSSHSLVVVHRSRVKSDHWSSI